MDVEIKIAPEYKIPKAVIMTDRINDEVNTAVSKLSEETPQMISGFRDSVLKIIEPDEIIKIYSSGGKVFAATESGEYVLRQRIYEMEERLEASKFVRISNSEIINLKKVKSFDLNFVGTICVVFKDSTVTYVSRRYVSKIKKVLGV